MGLLRIELSGCPISRWRGAFGCDALLDDLGMSSRSSLDYYNPPPLGSLSISLNPNRENDARGSVPFGSNFPLFNNLFPRRDPR